MANHDTVEFYGAGEPMISETKRAQSVRPNIGATLQPVYNNEGASGEEDTEAADRSEEVVPT